MDDFIGKTKLFDLIHADGTGESRCGTTTQVIHTSTIENMPSRSWRGINQLELVEIHFQEEEKWLQR